MAELNEKKHIVICGSGVIGVSTAYYLSLRAGDNVQITCIDEVGPAAAASGKAGGFLARSWCQGDDRDDLQTKSFDLHDKLAQLIGPQHIDYRKTAAFSVTCTSGNTKAPTKTASTGPTWISGTASVTASSKIGTVDDCAQVHPAKFVKQLAKLATANGAVFRQGQKVTQVLMSKNGKTTGVHLASGEVIKATQVVIALGPWSSTIEIAGDRDAVAQVQKLPVCAGLIANSIIIQADLPAESVFTNYDGKDPEMYPRMDGTVYVCGTKDNEEWDYEMKVKASDVNNNEEQSAQLRVWASGLSAKLGDTLVKQSCHLPMMDGGNNPVIGFLQGTNDTVAVAYGHSCWGICQGPGTGLVVSELMLDGVAKSINLAGLLPVNHT